MVPSMVSINFDKYNIPTDLKKLCCLPWCKLSLLQCLTVFVDFKEYLPLMYGYEQNEKSSSTEHPIMTILHYQEENDHF